MIQNTVCHIEIHTLDLERAQAFYASIFNWKFRPFVDAMTAFGTEEAHIGGLLKVDSLDPGDSPSVWIQVESIEASLKAAVAAGGAICDPKLPVPHVGFSAAFRDIDGNRIGIVEFVSE